MTVVESPEDRAAPDRAGAVLLRDPVVRGRTEHLAPSDPPGG
ncbi:MAG TPA: hypothetical protein VNG13_14945 [Mycobacteriales bacterium]|nr:hypothetical protein [Mycobacteriales bacterium]